MIQSPRHKSGCIPILLLMVVLTVVIVFGYYRVTSRVETNFGKPYSRLGIFQRVKQTLMLYQGDLSLSKPNTLVQETKFVVGFAEPVNSICAKLEAESAVDNGQLLCSYLIYKGLDRELQAGQFTILSQTTSIQVAQRITNPKLKDVLFTIYPGWRLQEVADAIRLAGYFESYENIVASLIWPDNDLSAGLGLPPGTSLEGYLCPANYAIKPETSMGELANLLTMCQIQYISNKTLNENINQLGLNFYQALTLASIIQRETLNSEEMPTIASVFYNRLSQGMRLQTDPTVQYALGFYDANKTWWKSGLTFADLEVESPYNTYRVTGLPPGPISVPSEGAIMAVANPSTTEFLYFRAKCDGSLTHVFSVTYEEHLLNACP